MLYIPPHELTPLFADAAGERAMGTVLDTSSPAFAAANKGDVYRGLALLFGKRYITQYQPVKNAEGQVIAIVFVGVDITHSWNVMREKILKSMGLSEDELKTLPPDEQNAIEAEIAKRIKEMLLEQQEAKNTPQKSDQATTMAAAFWAASAKSAI